MCISLNITYRLWKIPVKKCKKLNSPSQNFRIIYKPRNHRIPTRLMEPTTPFSAPHPSLSWLPCARGKHWVLALNVSSRAGHTLWRTRQEYLPGAVVISLPVASSGMLPGTCGTVTAWGRPGLTPTPPRPPRASRRAPPAAHRGLPWKSGTGNCREGGKAGGGQPPPRPPPLASLLSAVRPRPPGPPTQRAPGEIKLSRPLPGGAPAAGGGGRRRGRRRAASRAVPEAPGGMRGLARLLRPDTSVPPRRAAQEGPGRRREEPGPASAAARGRSSGRGWGRRKGPRCRPRWACGGGPVGARGARIWEPSSPSPPAGAPQPVWLRFMF